MARKDGKRASLPFSKTVEFVIAVFASIDLTLRRLETERSAVRAVSHSLAAVRPLEVSDSMQPSDPEPKSICDTLHSLAFARRVSDQLSS